MKHDTKLRILLASLLLMLGCSAIQPPDAGGPKGNQPAYPILFPEDPQRREAANAAFSQALGQPIKTGAATVSLQPITATIASIPSSISVFLPKVGTKPTMTEEETRESLRRFLDEWQQVIGTKPDDLSLVERTDLPGGLKLARYKQLPFRYPLRGPYGKLEIQFTSDRRVTNLSSTCIPDTDRLQSSLNAITPVLKSEDAVTFVKDNGASYKTSTGSVQTIRPAPNSLDASELVFYVMPSPTGLEFHLAWAVNVSNGPVKTIYVDAIKALVLGVD